MSDTFDYEPDPFEDDEQPIPCRSCGKPIVFGSYWDAAGVERLRPESPTTGEPHDCRKARASDFDDVSGGA